MIILMKKPKESFLQMLNDCLALGPSRSETAHMSRYTYSNACVQANINACNACMACTCIANVMTLALATLHVHACNPDQTS